jgi:hypothetical protein
MVLYSEKWNIPLMAFALMLLAAALFTGLRRRLITRKGVTSGFLSSLLALQGAVVLGIAAQLVFSGIYYKLNSVHSLTDLSNLRRTLIFRGNIWIIAANILSAVMLYLLQRLFRKKTTGYDLLVGSMFTWSILALNSALFLPGACYMFLWPLLLTQSGVLIDFLLIRSSGFKYLIPFLFSAVSCILIFLPVGYLTYQALTMLGAAIPVALLSLPLGLVLLTASLFSGSKNAASSG